MYRTVEIRRKSVLFTRWIFAIQPKSLNFYQCKCLFLIEVQYFLVYPNLVYLNIVFWTENFYSPKKYVACEQGTPLYFLSVFTEDNGSFHVVLLIPISADPL